MKIVPITLKAACAFIAQHHRHNKPPAGWKFGVGLECDGVLVGVATAGRPVARALDHAAKNGDQPVRLLILGPGPAAPGATQL